VGAILRNGFVVDKILKGTKAAPPPFLHRLVAFGDFMSSGSEQRDPAPSPKGILREEHIY